MLFAKRLELMLDELIDGNSRIEEIKKIDYRIDEISDVYDAAEFEVKDDVGFEKMCLFVSQELHADAKKMSVIEYESALKMIDEKQKELEKITNKHK